MKDVARLANVAPSTVSNALAGSDLVKEETRTRVIEAANSLGYRPSGIARALRLQRSSVIALMIGDITDSISAQAVLGIEDELLPYDYQLIICNTGYREDRETRHIDLLFDRRVDGVIVMSTSLHDGNVSRLQAERVKTVLLSRRSDEGEAHFVGVDNALGIRAAVHHLALLGHRRLAFVGGIRSQSSVAREKMDAFEHALSRESLGTPTIIETNLGFEEAKSTSKQMLSANDQNRPTGILSINDTTALGVIEAASEIGLSVPGDVSVIGWDDDFFASLGAVQLTTVRQPMREMGKASARLLIEDGGDAHKQQELIFRPELIVRGTTSAPPSR